MKCLAFQRNSLSAAVGGGHKEFVVMLYRSFLGRGLDPTGEKNWVAGLDKKTYKKEDVFNGVVYSPEFKAIAAEYGLVVG